MKDFRTHFKTLATSKSLTSTDIVQNCILRAMKITKRLAIQGEVSAGAALIFADKLIYKSFTPVTRKVKLDNGRLPYDKVYLALTHAADAKHFFEDDDNGLKDFVEYKDILKELVKQYSVYDSRCLDKEYLKRHYIYIFVRQDIFPEYQAVQACHVAAKMGHRIGQYPNDLFDGLYFTLVGVPDIKALQVAAEDIKAVGATVYTFHEPDIGNELTAVASGPIAAPYRKRLLSYKLLRFLQND
jgi:hypothetical protein